VKTFEIDQSFYVLHVHSLFSFHFSVNQKSFQATFHFVFIEVLHSSSYGVDMCLLKYFK